MGIFCHFSTFFVYKYLNCIGLIKISLYCYVYKTLHKFPFQITNIYSIIVQNRDFKVNVTLAIPWDVWIRCEFLKIRNICYINDHGYVSFVRNHNPVNSSCMTYHRVCNKSYTTGVSSGAGTAYSSLHLSSSRFCRLCYSIFRVLCSVL